MKSLILFLSIILLSTTSYAIPSYARQTGLSCVACHFQHFPTLNAFGRDFKANGYTLVMGKANDNLINGARMSLPGNLNASLVTKFRYQKTNGANKSGGTNKGEFQLPDEAALFLGGRISKNIGFILEGQLADNSSPFMASFKMPFTLDVKGVKLSAIPFLTDGLGAAFGFELLNTGSVRNVRIWENRKDVSAQQYLGTDGAATGLAFVAYKKWGFFNYTLYTPVQGTNDAGKYLKYIRAALTPTVGDWDLGFGTQIWTGSTALDAGTTKKSISVWSVDAQAQGALGTMPLGVYLSYGNAKKSSSVAGSIPNMVNSSTFDNKNAMSFSSELGIIPEIMTIGAAFRKANNGNVLNNKQNSITFAATYKVAQNVQFQLNHSIGSGDYYDVTRAKGNNLTTIMLFASF